MGLIAQRLTTAPDTWWREEKDKEQTFSPYQYDLSLTSLTNSRELTRIPVVRFQAFTSMDQVQPLVGKLRSHKLHDMGKKNNSRRGSPPPPLSPEHLSSYKMETRTSPTLGALLVQPYPSTSASMYLRIEVFQSSKPWQPGPHRGAGQGRLGDVGGVERRDGTGWRPIALQFWLASGPLIIAPSQPCTQVHLCAQRTTNPHSSAPCPALCSQFPGVRRARGNFVWSAPRRG